MAGLSDREVIVVFVEHRPEYLRELRHIFSKADLIILEEPHTPELEKVVRGLISPREYAESLYTEFPLYMEEQAKLLRELKSRAHLEIVGCEPYLGKLIEIYNIISREDGKTKLEQSLSRDNLLKLVHNVENIVSKRMLEYYNSLLSGDFEEVVNSIVNFARADSYRILIRDIMRATSIRDLLGKYENAHRVVIEAGIIHTALPIILKKVFHIDTKCINLKLLLLKRLGLKILPHPGNMLSKIFIHGLPFGRDFVRLLAARSLVYNMLILKEEHTPTSSIAYPHLVQEYKVLEIVNKLSYDMCRKIYEKYYRSVLRKGREV